MKPKDHTRIAFQVAVRALEGCDFADVLAEMEYEGLVVSGNDVEPILRSVEGIVLVLSITASMLGEDAAEVADVLETFAATFKESVDQSGGNADE